ncbi:hypothetical protein BOX17_16070 [Halomonas aestuarii]|uniref:J domain-containing protein n=1 Tax=Halomonas aestuarii TaxID=1897729 RepID=A0A1J0VJX5_9GAMM|nr:DnaJ domain-containing protein [Halomonas aestuarii]APE32340.1 hypothetical protein BOX17_16070 [Halomonas aestuarii]
MGSANNLFSEFERELLTSENQLGASMLLILAWLASADGHIDAQEREQFQEIVSSSKTKISTEYVIKVASSGDTIALQLACEILAEEMKGERAILLIQLAIGMAMADGNISPEEVHIIRFLSDLVNVSSKALDALFIELTGHSCPDILDLSRKDAWSQKKKKSQEDSSRQSGHQEEQSYHSRGGSESGAYARDFSFKEANALGILGLEPGATKQDIKRSYRRMAQIHHPDRYISLGDEAVTAATSHFQKINDAYEYLMRYA